MLRNEDLGEQLVPTLQKLLPDTERLDEMRKAMRKMSRPQAARSIAALLVELAGGGSW
jgi:UDP-N-acetylglucosamine:LPS N-acetylglucosamine transferase